MGLNRRIKKMTKKNNGAATFECILDDADKCIENGIYIGALDVALTIPDICGNIEFQGTSVGDRYKSWFKNYVCDEESQLTVGNYGLPQLKPFYDAELVYKLRCSMLHEGQPIIDYFGEVLAGEGIRGTLNFTSNGGSMFLSSGRNNLPHHKAPKINIFIDVCELSRKLISSGREYVKKNPEKFQQFLGIEKIDNTLISEVIKDN